MTKDREPLFDAALEKGAHLFIALGIAVGAIALAGDYVADPARSIGDKMVDILPGENPDEQPRRNGS